jgi:hypothetical protein
MSTERILPRGERSFVAILPFPLRTIERARGWRRIGLLLVYVLIALPILANLWRRSQLAGLPDVGNTFDVTASRPTPGVPDDRNAFVLYRRAGRRSCPLSTSPVPIIIAPLVARLAEPPGIVASLIQYILSDRLERRPTWIRGGMVANTWTAIRGRCSRACESAPSRRFA